MAAFPKTGRPWEDIRKRLIGAKESDFQWRAGRLPLYVYYDDEELLAVSKQAFNLYFSENALGRTAFPSVVWLEEEVVGMTLDLFGGRPESAGTFTSGGTESQFLALKAARNRARAERPRLCEPKVIVAGTCHPSISKAAHYLGLEVVRVPVLQDFRADVEAMSRAADDRTIMLVGSAPGYTHGVFDPIAELGQLALERDLWLHVDACLGGFLAPFARMEGYAIPAFDFTVPGVTSLAADLHKYGFSAKGASVLLLEDASLLPYQRYEFRDWPRGLYRTDTFLGSRPGGPAASAWSVMNYLGEAGYRDLARKILATKERLIAGIERIAGLEVVRPSELCMLLYRSRDPDLDINAVAEGMSASGWFVGRCLDPLAIHFAVNPVHTPVVGDYLRDLRDVTQDVRRTGRVGRVDEHTY